MPKFVVVGETVTEIWRSSGGISTSSSSRCCSSWCWPIQAH